MTALGQVGHVFVKDVKEQRWLLLVYVLAVVVATGHALHWRPFTAGVLGAAMMVVGLVGILLVASVVQGDSPTRSDAFWVTHPLDPDAVLGAKIVFVLAVLAIAVIGQTIAVSSFDPSRSQVANLVTHPALSFATVLLAAIVVASLTRDLRSFTLAAITSPLLILLTIAIVSAYVADVTPIDNRAAAAVRWMAVVVEAAIVLWLYHARDSRWRTRITGYVVAGISVVAMGARNMTPPGRRPQLDRGAVPRIAVSLEPVASTTAAPDQLSYILVVPPAPDGLVYDVLPSNARIRGTDGSTTTVDLGYEYFAYARTTIAAAPHIAGFRWLGVQADTGRRILLHGPLTTAQRKAIEAGTADIAIDVAIEVDSLEVNSRLPLAAGSAAKRSGRRTTIEKWRFDADGPDLVVHSAAIGSADEPLMPLSMEFIGGAGFALVNRLRGEALSLASSQAAMGIDGLVLPGSTITTSTLYYGRRAPQYLPTGLPDAAWYRDAELVTITPRPLGTYRVSFRRPTGLP